MASTGATSGRAHFLTTTAPMTVYKGTAPVDAYEPNGYGLYNVAGNTVGVDARLVQSYTSISRWATSADRAITRRGRRQGRPRRFAAARTYATIRTATATVSLPAHPTHSTAPQATSAFAASATPDTLATAVHPLYYPVHQCKPQAVEGIG